MDILESDILAFWKELNHNKVNYIMIGGFAVNMHGYSRATKDVDLWLKDTLSDRAGLRESLKMLGYGDIENLETLVFVPGCTTFYLGGVELDIMTNVKGLDEIGFDNCRAAASIANLEGVLVPFLHINHLIQAKEASGRMQDLADIEKLKKIYNLE